MPYVSLTAYYSPSFILNHGFPTCCYTLISFSRSILFSSINEAHPLAVKLIKLIKDGEIPESCIYYKFHNDTTSFALVDSKIASGFKWDDEVCEFFRPSNTLEVREQESSSEGQASWEQGEAAKRIQIIRGF